jgi:hypothetical protein
VSEPLENWAVLGFQNLVALSNRGLHRNVSFGLAA